MSKNKDYVDADVPCALQGHRVKMRCTSRGIITCRFPWKKCTFKKQDPDREDCSMNIIVKEMVEKMRETRAKPKYTIHDALMSFVLGKQRR